LALRMDAEGDAEPRSKSLLDRGQPEFRRLARRIGCNGPGGSLDARSACVATRGVGTER
jgi:hypothetical protein